MAREANAGRRKAAGTHGQQAACLQGGAVITGRIPDVSAGPERELTRAG